MYTSNTKVQIIMKLKYKLHLRDLNLTLNIIGSII